MIELYFPAFLKAYADRSWCCGAVGFGDMVPMTFVGRFAVLVMICVGVVLIPVQASQVYTQLQARRVTLGETAYHNTPWVI